jgi:N6-adenosine-specific RNA methylase IME4
MKKYELLYADPPWQYRNTMTGRNNTAGAESKYKTMPLEEICALPIADISKKSAALFLWITTPLLPNGFVVMDAWGFNYKTTIYWRKIMSQGLGNWFRGQVEVLLVGVRGRLKPFHCQKANFLQTKVGKHSQKPRQIYGLLESLELDPKIELFARDRRQGWGAWGDELPDTMQTLL